MGQVTTYNLLLGRAMGFQHSPGAFRPRIALHGKDDRVYIAVIPFFASIVEAMDRLIHYLFKRERKWVKVQLTNCVGWKSFVALNINSICKRTLLTRKELLSKSREELSKIIANPTNILGELDDLATLFPEVALISSSQEKKIAFETHLAGIGQSQLHYHTIDSSTGATQKQSLSAHLQALQHAKENNSPKILILEDTARFHTIHLSHNYLQKVMLQELPKDWGVLLLGCREESPQDVKEYSEHVKKPGAPQDIPAYVVNNSMYDTLITALQKEIASENPRDISKVYAELSKDVHNKHPLFACKDNLSFRNDSSLYPQESALFHSILSSDTVSGTTVDGLPVMDPLLAGTLYQMAHHLTTILDKHGIRYWADGGTILGMERHKGLIPHDDDIDLWIHPDDTHKLQSTGVQQALSDKGLVYAKHWIGAKICCKQKHPLGHSLQRSGYTFTTPSIDLFFTKRVQVDGEVAYTFLDKATEKVWPGYRHKEKDVFDENDKIQKKKFGPITLNTLRNPTEYCKRYYGQNCMIEAYLQFNHLTEKALSKKPIRLTDFRPPSFREWDQLPSLSSTQVEAQT